MTQTERRRFLLSRLLAEAPEYRQLAVPDDAAGQKQLLRALLNVRPPRDASPEFLQVQDEYLRAELAQKGVTVLESLTPAARCGEVALYLWQGDITTLQCDAINKGEAVCPNEIAKQSLLFDGDIAAVLAQMIREHGFIVSDS